MKEIIKRPFEEYLTTLGEDESSLISEFFDNINIRCILSKKEKKKLREDFERAILYYDSKKIPLCKALEILSPENLGGFYARPPVLWFPLDDAAKVYPLSMEHGTMPVFRLAVCLKHDVVPELLQMALTFTIKRFPGFATTLKKGFFWHYLDTAKRRFEIEQECDLPCRPLKVSASGSMSFRVMYYKKRISVEFFHVLTDGTGGMIFLKTLISEYLRLFGINAKPCGEIWDVNETPMPEEFENSFAKVQRPKTSSGFVDKISVQMNGRLSKCKPCRIIHFKLDCTALKTAAKKYGTTVTAYLLSLMFLAGRAATDEFHGETSIQVPVNMRKFYPSKTLRNFSLYCGIRLPLDSISDIPSAASEITKQMEEKASVEAMSKMLNSTEKMVNAVRFIPLAVKQPVAKAAYGFLGDKIFSNTLSNLGVVKMPEEFSEHIDSMEFVLGTVITNRAACTAVTYGNVTTFTVTKLTTDPTFEEKMYELFCRDGIKVRVEGSGLYEN